MWRLRLFSVYSSISKYFKIIVETIKKYPKLSLIALLFVILIFYRITNNNLKEDIKEKNEVIAIKEQNEKKKEEQISVKVKLDEIENKNTIEFEKNFKENMDKIKNAKEGDKILIKI